MNKKIQALGAAIATTLGTADADATTYTAVLKQISWYQAIGTLAGEFGSSTATWTYDDVSGLLSQAGGTFNVRFSIAPNSVTMFRHVITGLTIGSGAAATATSFSCNEGNYGDAVGVSVCGGYNFGSNSVNNSSTTWGPGTAFARTLGGDDMALSAPLLQQSISYYDAFTTVSWVGTTLVLSNAVCNPAAPGNASGCATLGGYNWGYRWTLSTHLVPVPPAVWLFGSALAALGVARNRAKARS
jgi:hypothetical protein